MKTSEQFREAIAAADITLVQSVIIGQMDSDRFLEEPLTRQLCGLAEAELGKQSTHLFEQEDGEAAFPARAEWTRDAWTMMKVELGDNFSRKKFDLLIEMQAHLRESGHPKFQPRKRDSGSVAESRKRSSAGTGALRRPTAAGRTRLIGGGAGAALGLGVGLLVRRPVVGLLLGALAGLCAVTYSERRRGRKK